MVAHPQEAPRVGKKDERIDLARGAWRIQRDSLVEATGEGDFESGISEVVDGFQNYRAGDGVVELFGRWEWYPTRILGETNLMISDSFFYADFWYRNEFVIARPAADGTCGQL